MRLGIDAYRKAQGGAHPKTRVSRDAGRKTAKGVSDDLKTAPETSARALKSEVLRSLHPQSNSGMVSMRDVATALDHILKR